MQAITIQVPLRQPKLSSTGNTVLLGTFSGRVETEFGTLRVTANVMAPADDAETAAIIGKVAKAVARDPQSKPVKADKSAAKATVLKSLQALPTA